MKKELTLDQCKSLVTGEVVTLTAVLAICAIAITAVIMYRMFMSSEGSASIPGGWKFGWK